MAVPSHRSSPACSPRDGVCRALKTSADDELGLLLAVGSDTIGDVQVVPSGTPLVAAAPLLEIPADLSSFSFEAALASSQLIDRVGLPGVQDKVSGRMISVPAGSHGTDLIVKLAPPEYPGVIENEAFFLQLAKTAAIKTVEWQVLVDGHGVRALALRRFDRLVRGQTTRRLAFEDATQVLGLWPADKYNVSLEEASTALIRLTAAPLVAARDLFLQVAFAVLTGNGDQHGKNLAVLATENGEWRISPAFDLPSTLPYGDETTALPIGGSKQPFSRRKLTDFGVAIGLPLTTATRLLDQLLARTSEQLQSANVGTLPFSATTLTKLSRSLAYRRRQLSA